MENTKKNVAKNSILILSFFLRPLVQSYTFRREGLEQSPAPVSMFRSMSSIIIQAELLWRKHSKSRQNYHSEDTKLLYKEFLLE